MATRAPDLPVREPWCRSDGPRARRSRRSACVWGSSRGSRRSIRPSRARVTRSAQGSAPTGACGPSLLASGHQDLWALSLSGARSWAPASDGSGDRAATCWRPRCSATAGGSQGRPQRTRCGSRGRGIWWPRLGCTLDWLVWWPPGSRGWRVRTGARRRRPRWPPALHSRSRPGCGWRCCARCCWWSRDGWRTCWGAGATRWPVSPP